MDRETIEIIKRYKEELRKLGIRPERVVLYGSRAKGKGDEHSDIDVVVISRDFAPMNLLERLEILRYDGRLFRAEGLESHLKSYVRALFRPFEQ